MAIAAAIAFVLSISTIFLATALLCKAKRLREQEYWSIADHIRIHVKITDLNVLFNTTVEGMIHLSNNICNNFLDSQKTKILAAMLETKTKSHTKEANVKRVVFLFFFNSTNMTVT